MAGFKDQAQPQRRRPQTRTIDGSFQRAEGKDNQYALSFSSEEPYVRWGVPEILDHTPEAVDLSRLNEIGVLLFNHDTHTVLGKVIEASIENGRGVAVVEMDTDEFSKEIQAKVESGTLKGVSVRYHVGSWEEVSAGSTSADGRFTGPCDIARKWEPLEISIVSVPADATVGVGRSENYENEEAYRIMAQENSTKTLPAEAQRTEVVHVNTQSAVGTTEQPNFSVLESAKSVQHAADGINSDEIQRSERQRAADITNICREFGMDDKASEFIQKGTSVADVNAAVLERLRQDHPPVDVSVQRDEGDKFRAAASDSLILRSGIQLEKPADGAQDMRTLRLRDLMNVCARHEGVKNPEMMQPEDLMRQFFTPTAAFPAILDNAVNKSYVQGYQTYPATFESWTTKGQLSDFKPSRAYTLGNAGEFLLVPEGGELKHDTTATHARPDRQLKTWGRQFTLTREAIYNDDISLVTTIPARYASAARRTVNRQVYNILATNPVIYDGTTLFSATHGNLVTPGTAPSLASLEAAMNRLALMQNEDGEMIYAVPRYIIVPVGLGNLFRQIIGSVTISVETGGIITSQSNPLYGRGLEVIEDPMLNTLSTNGSIEWYLAADKTSVPTIQVDYLNGNEIPTIRRMEYPGQLGYIWDIVLDWGITVMDYRGIIKNEGAQA